MRTHLGLERGGVLSFQALVGLTLGHDLLEEAGLPIVALTLRLVRCALGCAAEVARGTATARADAERARAAAVPVEGLVAAVGALHGAAVVAQLAHDARHAACWWVWVRAAVPCVLVP